MFLEESVAQSGEKFICFPTDGNEVKMGNERNKMGKTLVFPLAEQKFDPAKSRTVSGADNK